MKKVISGLLSFFMSILILLSCTQQSLIADAYSETTPVTLYIASIGDYSFPIEVGYSDSFFYRDNTKYYSDLSLMSLVLSMAGFTAPEAYVLPEEERFPGNTNIRMAYNELGFSDDIYYNYTAPLDDTSDKVAFSFATKYIMNSSGTYDTLVAVVIRGANYGGEWVSNFHIYDSDSVEPENHFGFQTAANDVYYALNNYLKERPEMLKGDLKIWTTGYSRSASVANILSHMINNADTDDYISKVFDRDGLYSYEFACPPGARGDGINGGDDSNIFVINSPCDMIPMIPFEKWGFTSYGNHITLPDTMTENAQEIYNTLVEGTKYEGTVPCDEKQAEDFSLLIDMFSATLSESLYQSFLQRFVMNMISSTYEEESDSTITGVFSTNSEFIKKLSNLILKYSSFDLEKNINGIVNAHLPEHYLAIAIDLAEQDIAAGSDTDFYNDTDSSLISGQVPGDVDADGNVTLADVTYIQKNIANLLELSSYQFAAADVNNDKQITLDDAVQIQKYIARLIPGL